MTEPASDFDVAKAVAELLKGMDGERQQRILRWVAESLNFEVSSLAPTLDRQVAGQPDTGAISVVGGAAVAGRQHGPTDIKSFVDSKRPKSDVQFAAAVAYYYRFEAASENRRDSIDASLLQEAARLAGRRRPSKAKDTLKNAKNQGYLDSTERGQFRINSVGENLVAMTLPGSGQESAPRRSARPRSARKAGAPKPKASSATPARSKKK